MAVAKSLVTTMAIVSCTEWTAHTLCSPRPLCYRHCAGFLFLPRRRVTTFLHVSVASPMAKTVGQSVFSHLDRRLPLFLARISMNIRILKKIHRAISIKLLQVYEHALFIIYTQGNLRKVCAVNSQYIFTYVHCFFIKSFVYFEILCEIIIM